MNTKKIYFGMFAVMAAFVFFSCASPVQMTSWTNPAVKAQVSNVVIMPLFEKLEYIKPFEQSMDVYFNSKGLKSMGSLSFLNPNVKYSIDEIKQKCDSLGADGILVFNYTGTDKSENYVPPTTYNTGAYGGYWGGGYWGAGYYGGYYGGYGGPGYYGGNTVTTGGYWTTTSVVNLKASLYTKASKDAIWTGDISITDPNYVDQSATTIAQDIYSDWQKNGLLKFAPAKK